MERVERSAGGVVYRRNGDATELLLIRDRFGKMTLAKGKMEPGETIEETALREIAEETGVIGRIVAPLETVTYTYSQPGGRTVRKQVHYFLVEALQGQLRPQAEEIDGAGWHLPEAALLLQRRHGYRNNDPVLKRALDVLGIEGESDERGRADA